MQKSYQSNAQQSDRKEPLHTTRRFAKSGTIVHYSGGFLGEACDNVQKIKAGKLGTAKKLLKKKHIAGLTKLRTFVR